MVRYNTSLMPKVMDVTALAGIGILGGYLIFALEWLKESFTNFTVNLLPQSLSSYDFLSSIQDAWGIGVFALIVATIMSIFLDDDDTLDNMKQMLIGLIIGSVIYCGFVWLDWFSIGSLAIAGSVISTITLIIFAVWRVSQ